ncbi:putative small heat-shock protein [Hibiscus syriacus]|uniref:Small heat-shock protein n=1 Tax=Hibiscus syriacus TaxID=106335 RepID=A0A6A2YN89_HIBSY|nr:putative small heat-shock protein [Hibiscus syriacus]
MKLPAHVVEGNFTSFGGALLMNLLGVSVLYLDSSGCLGCYERPTLNPLVNESTKRLKIQGQTGKKASISENFWTTSTCDMDNSAVQSQGSISSISTSNQTLDLHGSVAAANAPREFAFFSGIKFGSAGWETGSLKIGSESWNATYESLLGSNKPFPQPIPLPEMIDFLVDVWEQEGLYD